MAYLKLDYEYEAKTLTNQEREDYTRAWVDQGDLAARDELISSHLNKAISVACGYASRTANHETLITESWMFLVDAMEKARKRKITGNITSFVAKYIKLNLHRYCFEHEIEGVHAPLSTCQKNGNHIVPRCNPLNSDHQNKDDHVKDLIFQDCVDRASRGSRDIVKLWLQGYTQEEICQSLMVGNGTVARDLFVFKHRFRELWDA